MGNRQFKIEALTDIDRAAGGLFEDMVAGRFETIAAALAVVAEFTCEGNNIQVVDTENATVVWKNYEGDLFNTTPSPARPVATPAGR